MTRYLSILSICLYVFTIGLFTLLQPPQGDDLDVVLLWGEYTKIDSLQDFFRNVYYLTYSEYYRLGATVFAPLIGILWLNLGGWFWVTINIIIQSSVIFVLFRLSFRRNFNVNSTSDILSFCLIALMSLTVMPVPGETVIWNSGVFSYSFALLLMLLPFSYIIVHNKTSNLDDLGYFKTIILAICFFVSPFSNEALIPVSVAIFLWIVFECKCIYNSKIPQVMMVFVLLYILGLGLALYFPGWRFKSSEDAISVTRILTNYNIVMSIYYENSKILLFLSLIVAFNALFYKPTKKRELLYPIFLLSITIGLLFLFVLLPESRLRTRMFYFPAVFNLAFLVSVIKITFDKYYLKKVLVLSVPIFTIILVTQGVSAFGKYSYFSRNYNELLHKVEEAKAQDHDFIVISPNSLGNFEHKISLFDNIYPVTTSYASWVRKWVADYYGLKFIFSDQVSNKLPNNIGKLLCGSNVPESNFQFVYDKDEEIIFSKLHKSLFKFDDKWTHFKVFEISNLNVKPNFKEIKFNYILSECEKDYYIVSVDLSSLNAHEVKELRFEFFINVFDVTASRGSRSLKIRSFTIEPPYKTYKKKVF